MNLEQRLRESLVAPDPGAVFTARVMARMTRGRARKGRRFLVIGAVLVAGVAAAMLVWQTSQVRPTPQQAEIALTQTVRESEPVAVEQVVPPAPVAEEPLAAPSMPEMPPAASPRYSVLVMPLHQNAQDAAGRGQVEAFYSSVLEELSKAPGITLQVPGGSADYVLTITSLATHVSPSGNTQVRATDGGATYVAGSNLGGYSVDVDYNTDPLTGNREVGETRSYEAGGAGGQGSVAWIEMRVESRGAAPAWYTFPIGIDGSSNQRPCATADASVMAECLHPVQLAARQVEKLRMQVFPPDAALQQSLVARLGNARLSQAEQMQVLQHLLLQGNGSRLDVTTLRTLTRQATSLPASSRQQVWSMLRRLQNPVLIAPLIESLRRDADRRVRLEALATLTASFATEPAVRAALESVAQEDPDDVVRIAARREVFGQAQWRNDVIAVLDNPALSYESRLAPLRTGPSAFSTSLSGDLQALVRDRQVMLKLVDLVRQNLGDSGSVLATREMLILLAGTNDPVVSELFAEARRKGIQIPGSGLRSGAMTIDGRFVDENGQNVDEKLVPSGLLERMREVTQKPQPAGQ